MIIELVRFASRLTADEVRKRFEAGSGKYRQVPGLLQKYYVHHPATDEYGGVYVWDTEDSLQAWRETYPLSTLAGTYQVNGEPHRELLDVLVELHADGSV